MTIHHHLDHATLMSYASGALGEALSTAVIAHLQMCPKCCEDARRLNVLGGVMLEQSAPVELSMAPAAAKELLGATIVEVPTLSSQPTSLDVPPVIHTLLDVPLEQVPWQRLVPGISTHRFDLSDGEDGDLRLMHVAAGVTLPEHSHAGSEITLILKGAYKDCFGRFGPGDVADFDEEFEHKPVVEMNCECICLVASEAPALFSGLLSKLMQPPAGI